MLRHLPPMLAALLFTVAAATAQDGVARLPPPDGMGAQTTGPGAKGGADANDATLSEKLSKSDGVLRPPKGVDPEIRTIPPQTSSEMPVIKPPGIAK